MNKNNGDFIGVLKKCQLDRSFNNLVEVLTLYRLKESKSYKDAGMTWGGACEAAGIERRTADRIIDDIRPIAGKFSDTVSDFFGLKLNEIRLLGRSVSDNLAEIKDDHIVYEGEKIPFRKNDLKELLNRLEASYKDRLEDQKKQAAKELSGKDKELLIANTNIKYLEGKLQEFRGLLPDKPGMSLAQKRMAFLENLYAMLDSALSGFAFSTMVIQDDSTPAWIEGFVKKMQKRVMEFEHKWERFQKGEYKP